MSLTSLNHMDMYIFQTSPDNSPAHSPRYSSDYSPTGSSPRYVPIPFPQYQPPREPSPARRQPAMAVHAAAAPVPDVDRRRVFVDMVNGDDRTDVFGALRTVFEECHVDLDDACEFRWNFIANESSDRVAMQWEEISSLYRRGQDRRVRRWVSMCLHTDRRQR